MGVFELHLTEKGSNAKSYENFTLSLCVARKKK